MDVYMSIGLDSSFP